MWPHGRRWMPHPAQNLTSYNPRGYVQTPNQQGTIYTSYAPYSPNPSYSQQEAIGYMTYAPYPQYSQQEIGHTIYAPYPLYSQQEVGTHLSQDPMASDMVIQDQRDQNWFFQNRYRRETMPEYRNGEVVMVRCNQQKWLYGVIQRMSAQGVRIWIFHANILVNVPLVLLPTHVFKISTYSQLQTLPQAEPMWTTTDNRGYRKVLVQCVRPAHLSHRQLFRPLDSNVCAFCKMSVLNTINVVSPWNCRHQVHNHCLQLQVQNNSTISCPFCNERTTYQLMPLASTSNALNSPNNEQQQQWLDLQCACGFKSAIVGVGNKDVPIICPNCHQLVNVHPMTIIMQSEQPLASMNLLRTYLEPERDIPQSSDFLEIPERERFFSAQDFRFGWPTQSSSGPKRLEAIEEGREGFPSPKPNMPLESPATNEGREETSYLPLYIQILRETFEHNNISDPNVVAEISINQDRQPLSNSRSSWHNDSLYEPSYNQSILIQNEQYSSSQSSLQDGPLNAPYSTPATPIQNEQSIPQNSSQDGLMGATFPTPIALTQNEQSRNNAPGPMQLAIVPPTPTLTTQVKLIGLKETYEPMEKLETNKTIDMAIEKQKLLKRSSEPNMAVAAIEGHKLWKRLNEPNTTVVATEGHRLLKRVSEPNATHAATKDQKSWKRTSEPNISIADIEGQKLLKKMSEPNTTHVATKDQKLWKEESEPNSIIAVTKIQNLLERGSEPNMIVTTTGDQKLWKKVNETNTTIAVIEGQKFLKRESEPNTIFAATEDRRLWKNTSEPNTIHAATEKKNLLKKGSETDTTHATSEDKILWKRDSKINTTIAVIEGQRLLKLASEPNRRVEAIEDQRLWKKSSEPNTTHEAIKDDKILKKKSEPNKIVVAAEEQKLWRRASETNKTIVATKGQRLWRRTSEVDLTNNLGNDKDSKEIEEDTSSNNFIASSSNVVPVYVNHFVPTTEGQKLWRRASEVDWTSTLEINDERDEDDSSNDFLVTIPGTAPVYVNHFVDFVKLAMDGASTAKDIIASASPTTSSSSTANPPPLESATPPWISPPPAFFTRASTLFTEAPAWVTLTKNPDEAIASPTWITVIKDGIDSRNDDKQWELDRLVKTKESKFL